MMFDFMSLVRDNSIPYITQGKNVARGHFNIQCPFCGSSDPSYHMGIEITSGRWGCWRESLHRGARPERLIQALLNCSWEEAKAIAGSGSVVESIGFDELKQRAEKLFASSHEHFELEPLEYDPEIKDIVLEGLRGRFFKYLESRGFAHDDIQDLVDTYDLRCALNGKFGGRVILPFWFKGDLVGWTGRAVGQSELRYVSYPAGDSVKRIVYNYDVVRERSSKTLVITEGPMDALKVDFYGSLNSVASVAVLGVAVVDAQVSIVLDLAKYFKQVVVWFDPGAYAQGRRLADQLAHCSSKAFNLEGYPDPGDMSKGQIEMLSTLLDKQARQLA